MYFIRVVKSLYVIERERNVIVAFLLILYFMCGGKFRFGEQGQLWSSVYRGTCNLVRKRWQKLIWLDFFINELFLGLKGRKEEFISWFFVCVDRFGIGVQLLIRICFFSFLLFFIMFNVLFVYVVFVLYLMCFRIFYLFLVFYEGKFLVKLRVIICRY